MQADPPLTLPAVPEAFRANPKTWEAPGRTLASQGGQRLDQPMAAARASLLLRDWRVDQLDAVSLPVWPVGWVLGGLTHRPWGGGGQGKGENALGAGTGPELALQGTGGWTSLGQPAQGSLRAPLHLNFLAPCPCKFPKPVGALSWWGVGLGLPWPRLCLGGTHSGSGVGAQDGSGWRIPGIPASRPSPKQGGSQAPPSGDHLAHPPQGLGV